MKINQKVQLVADGGITLVPYRKYHVPRYHKWMCSQELQELTRSDPLSLDEEYDNQISWAVDEDKLTFIVLQHDESLPPIQAGPSTVDHMIGDVNVFRQDGSEDAAEIDIMIAESSCRGRGSGARASAIMMQYVISHLGIRQLYAKISRQNAASIKLFHGKFGFDFESESEVFDEATYCKRVDAEFEEKLKSIYGKYTIVPYDDDVHVS